MSHVFLFLVYIIACSFFCILKIFNEEYYFYLYKNHVMILKITFTLCGYFICMI